MRPVVLLLLLAPVVACSHKSEASAVVGAIDRFRDADNDHKPEMADALEKVGCSDPEICAAKDACMKVARPTARGLRLQREVKDGLADVESGKLSKDDPAAKALAGKLADADALMNTAEAALTDCTEHTTALRIKYSL